jgi:hypothetical protein
MMTMGQAVDAATEHHCRTYSDSDVLAATVSELLDEPFIWVVEIHADHFSQNLTYHVFMSTGSVSEIRR